MRNGSVFPVSRPANEMAAEPLSHPRCSFIPEVPNERQYNQPRFSLPIAQNGSGASIQQS